MEVNNFDRKSQREVEATKRLFEENEEPSDLLLSNLAMHSETTEGDISIAKRSEAHARLASLITIWRLRLCNIPAVLHKSLKFS